MSHVQNSSDSKMHTLEAYQEPGKEIASGTIGIVIFSLLSAVLWLSSPAWNGLAFYLVRAGAVVFGALALMALAGSAYGVLLWFIPATKIQVDRDVLLAGQPFQIRLTQRGPLLISSIAVELICSQTGFDEEEREWVHALLSRQRPVRVEELDSQFENIELLRTELFRAPRLYVPRSEPLQRDFSCDLPEHAGHAVDLDAGQIDLDAVSWTLEVTVEVPWWLSVRKQYELAIGS